MTTPLRSMIPRHITPHILEALACVRIVAIAGPRQSGKTTLVRDIAQRRKMAVVSLDDKNARNWATLDPKGFLEEHTAEGGLVIDEIQRIPDLILALKYRVDEDPTPGRFIITGSVDFFSSTQSPDSLAGRMLVVPLFPFSVGEIEQRPVHGELFERLFNDRDLKKGKVPSESRSQLTSRILGGGYPDYYRLPTSRRFRLMRSYITNLLRKDTQDLTNLRNIDVFLSMAEEIATYSGQLLNYTRLGSAFRVSDNTMNHWISILEQLFLMRRLKGWHPREPLRGVRKRKKIYFLDTGLLGAIQKRDEASIKKDPSVFGHFLENFVFTEMLKILSCPFESETEIYYYRDTQKTEVDFILERAGKIIAVEVKASTVVGPEDVKGLKKIQSLCGDAFKAGIVLHPGDRIQNLGHGRLFGVPISSLWL